MEKWLCFKGLGMGRSVVLAFALVASMALAGCGSDPQVQSLNCTRNAEKIAEARDCRADDHCPCGSHCELGQCIATCSTANDCSDDQYCDDFGSCRALSDSEIVPALRPSQPVRVRVDARKVELAATGQSYTVAVYLGLQGKSPTGQTVGPMRVAAQDGLQLRCEAGGELVSECRFENGRIGQRYPIEIQTSESFAGARNVRVFAGDSMAVVSVSMATATMALTDPQPLSGQYEGVLQAGQLAMGASDVRLLTRDADLTVPVTAKIFGDSGTAVIEIDDPLRVLGADGKWIGNIDVGSGALTLPKKLYRQDAATPDFATELLVSAAPTTIVHTATAGSVFAQLNLSFEGSLAQSNVVHRNFSLILRRTGEATGSAPSVPADAIATLTINARANNLTVWDAALQVAANYIGLRPEGAAATWFPDTPAAASYKPRIDVFASRDSAIEGLTKVEFGGYYAFLDVGTMFGTPFASYADVINQLTYDVYKTHWINIEEAHPEGIPCSAPSYAAPITYSGSGTADQQAVWQLEGFDACDHMAETYGCTVKTPNVGTWNYARVNGYLEYGGNFLFASNIVVDRPVLEVCALPNALEPAGAAEALACYEIPVSNQTNEGSMESSAFADTVRAVSGDLDCVATGTSLAFPFDDNAELPVDDPGRRSVRETLDACVDELTVLAALSAPTPSASYGEGMAELLNENAACIDAGRFFMTLDRATASSAPRSQAIASRLLQRWLQLHTFLARETKQSQEVSDAFDAASLPADTPALPGYDLLTLSLDGWELFYHPRFATLLNRMPAEVLYESDYRTRAGATVVPNPNHEQPVNLAVAMVEALAAQVELANTLADSAWMRYDLAAIDPLSEVLRAAAVIRPMAAELAQRAREYAEAEGLSEPEWANRFERADASLADNMGRLVASLDGILNGKNPFGIEDSDTPLYFYADAEGNGGRFCAISNFLLGEVPGVSWAWVPALLEDSAAALESARAAWIDQQDRNFEVALADAEAADRITELKLEYGNQILELCGVPDGMDSIDIMTDWTLFSAESCYIREDAACQVDYSAYFDALKLEDVQMQLCISSQLRKSVGDVISFQSKTLTAISDSYDSCSTWSYEPRYCLGAIFGGPCIQCDDKVGYLSVQDLTNPNDIDDATAQLIADLTPGAIETCQALIPGAPTSLPSVSTILGEEADAVDDPSCYRGSVGELAMAVRTAALDIEIANAEFAEYMDTYEILMRACYAELEGAQSVIDSMVAFEDTMSDLRLAKLAADETAAAADATAQCSSSFDLTSLFAFGATCAASAVEGVAEASSLGLQAEMDAAEAQHDIAVAQLEANAAFEVCIIEAEQALIGMDAAALTIDRAQLDLVAAESQLRDAKALTKSIWNEGQAALASGGGEQYALSPFAHDLWLDERVTSFARKFRLAKRAVYLATRALEYEFQISTTLGTDVLEATNVSQLEDVMRELQVETVACRLGGKIPTDLKIVLSLKENLLQLLDKADAPKSELPLDDTQRFRLLLRSPRFAEYDKDGKYLGQRIPFRIAPLQALNLGDPGGIPVFADSDCAERLWSVNASVIGDENKLATNDQVSVRIDLLKSNTFFSQWCEAPTDGEDPFQVASVRPSRNLFREPRYGSDVADELGLGAETGGFAKARIEAFFNVSREDFTSDDYANGDSSELAARGLYGDYALFIPAGVVSSLDKNGKATGGLNLGAVDDILLRLDYISVAK